ncbi:hypothetical protein DFH09DRAFT_1072659 [Mycena vulgaris]|nr:hypothetical protein DFH09DRAFT_1072659 [Mycena vulgaris]
MPALFMMKRRFRLEQLLAEESKRNEGVPPRARRGHARTGDEVAPAPSRSLFYMDSYMHACAYPPTTTAPFYMFSFSESYSYEGEEEPMTREEEPVAREDTVPTARKSKRLAAAKENVKPTPPATTSENVKARRKNTKTKTAGAKASLKAKEKKAESANTKTKADSANLNTKKTIGKNKGAARRRRLWRIPSLREDERHGEIPGYVPPNFVRPSDGDRRIDSLLRSRHARAEDCWDAPDSDSESSTILSSRRLVSQRPFKEPPKPPGQNQGPGVKPRVVGGRIRRGRFTVGGIPSQDS